MINTFIIYVKEIFFEVFSLFLLDHTLLLNTIHILHHFSPILLILLSIQPAHIFIDFLAVLLHFGFHDFPDLVLFLFALPHILRFKAWIQNLVESWVLGWLKFMSICKISCFRSLNSSGPPPTQEDFSIHSTS